MGIIDHSKLPLIKSFNELKYGDTVYSDKHSLGSVISYYKKDIIIDFSGHRIRFSPEEHDLKEIPKSWLKKKNKKIMLEVNGQVTTLRELKHKRKLEDKLAKLLK